jgi:hypothetical protein
MTRNHMWEKFSSKAAIVIAHQIEEELLVPWAAKEGLAVNINKNITYQAHEISFKITIKIPDAARLNEEKDYNEWKGAYGIKAPFGFTFLDNVGHTLQVSGLNHRATKNKILYTMEDGREGRSSVVYLNHEYKRSQM